VVNEKKIVIIGNGIAGNSAAAAIRKIDKNSEITIISEEAETVYSACALPYYISGEVQREKVYLNDLREWSEKNVRLMLGKRVTEFDVWKKLVYLDSQILPYDKLIIATGGRVALPPIRGLQKEGVHTLKSLAGADKIANSPAKSAAIIGSGFIGVELAIALRMKGLRVYLVEMLDRILPRTFDEKPARHLLNIIRKNGIEVFINEKVTRITGGDKVKGIATDKRELQCEMVILNTGMVPNVELARNAGLRIGELGGIVTDSRMKTSAEDVYTCGDCVESRNAISGCITLSLLWPNAKQQGVVAGRNCIDNRMEYTGSIDITGLCVFGTHAVSVGCTAGGSGSNNVKILEYSCGENYQRWLVENNRLIGAQSIGKTEDIGILMGVMRRKDNINRVREIYCERSVGAVQLMAAFNKYFL
jgi:NAD(P)H-nitrite reductase large subunit